MTENDILYTCSYAVHTEIHPPLKILQLKENEMKNHILINVVCVTICVATTGLTSDFKSDI